MLFLFMRGHFSYLCVIEKIYTWTTGRMGRDAINVVTLMKGVFYFIINTLIYNNNLSFCMLNENPEYGKIFSFKACLY